MLQLLPYVVKRDEESSEISSFQLHPWLRDEESEEECLRQICEAALLLLLPSSYSRSDHLRHLLREVITTSGLMQIHGKSLEESYHLRKLMIAECLENHQLRLEVRILPSFITVWCSLSSSSGFSS